MLGLILIYFIGKEFFKLADKYNKSKWGYAILGVITYYGTAVGGLILMLLYSEMYGDGGLVNTSDIGLTFMGMPIGILCSVALYFLLQYRWKKNEEPEENMIDEIGKS